jgi:outer membrane receptor protein involved in Fe transport
VKLRAFALAVLAGMLLVPSSAALAQATGSVAGVVIDVSSGGALQGATVELLSGEVAKATVSTDRKGAFSFANVAPGTYSVRTASSQFQTSTSAPFSVAAGEQITLSVDLQPVSTTSMKTIGAVSVQGQSVSNSSASTTTISATTFTDQGVLQIQNVLDQLPGVTIEHYDNGAPGNVTTLAIRGAGGFVGGTNTGYEVLVLQDGEPLRNGEYGDFDLSSLTPGIYSSIELIKGVGGTSLFGANTIGGTLNLETRDPTKTFGADLIGGFGTWGTSQYDLLVSDTVGKVGWLIDEHEYGTSGYIPANFWADFAPYEFSGGCGPPDICALAKPTQTFTLKSSLYKLRYDFSPTTSLTLAVSDESDYRDQLGLLANSNDSGNDPFGYPYFYGFPDNYVWNIEPKYSADFHTQVAGGDLILRSYYQTLERVVDGLAGPAAAGGPFETRSVDRLAGDELLYEHAFGNHTLTFGAGGNGDNYFASELTQTNPAFFTFNGLSVDAAGTQIERSYLLRDEWQATPRLNFSLAGYYSDYDTLNVRRFDPRFGAVYRPDNETALRMSVGTGFAPPEINDIVQTLNLDSNASVTAPQCPKSEYYCVATDGNPGVKAETAVGYDIGAERHFLGSGLVSVDAYRTNVSGHIFEALIPAPAGLTFTSGSAAGTPVLFINQPINLAGTVFQGLEFTTKLPVPGVRQLTLDGLYDTQAAYPTGVPFLTESNLGNVVNGEQYEGVPLHKYGYGIEFNSIDRRTNAFFQGTYYDQNNAFSLPAFWLWNAGFTVPFGQQLIHVTDSNVFNKNAFLFANYDGGVPYQGISGPYATTSYGVAPHTIMVTVERKLGALAR